MPTDNFPRHADAVHAPASNSFTILPHDGNALSGVTKGIYIGTGGHVAVRLRGDTTDRLFRNLPDASLLPVRATHVRAAGTTATDLIGLI